MDVVDQGIDEDNQVGRLELQRMEIPPPKPLAVYHMRDGPVHLISARDAV
jgi:hypothetical protein